jgi:NADH:ubiquinone oxidoreductase subunit K
MLGISDISMWLSDPTHRDFVGSLAALFCVSWSAWIAFTDLQFNSRLFTVMALFACAWLLVAGSYDNPEEQRLSEPNERISDLGTDVASCLMAYIGGLLVLEVPNPQRRQAAGVSWLQCMALLLLLFVAVPRAIPFPFGAREIFDKAGLSPHQAKVIVSVVLALIGHISVAWGVRTMCRLRTLLLFLTILLVVESSDFYFLRLALSAESAREPMPALFVLWFAGGKIAYAISFGLIISNFERRREVLETTPLLRARSLK